MYSLKDKILISLYFSQPFSKLKTGSLESGTSVQRAAYGYLYQSFAQEKPVSIRSSVKRLIDSNRLEKLVVDDRHFVQLTSSGLDWLESNVACLGNQEKASGECHLCLFSFLEKEKKIRDRIRKKLQSFGFVKWRAGVYVTLFNISEDIKVYLSNQSISGSSSSEVYLVKTLWAGEELKRLASSLWNLDDLYNQYLKFVSQARGVLKTLERKKSAMNWDKVSHELQEQFFKLLETDPGLPGNALPDDWMDKDAVDCYYEICQENLRRAEG